MSKPVFTRAEREREGLRPFAHPLNPGRSEMRGISLSEHAGLARVAERHRHEVAEFPREGKLMVRTGFEARLYDLASAQPMRAAVGDEPKKP